MRRLGLALLVATLLAGTLLGCAISPAEVEATRKAWAERDADRARECRQRGGGFVAGGCVFGGQ